jgi:hypothetical protein
MGTRATFRVPFAVTVRGVLASTAAPIVLAVVGCGEPWRTAAPLDCAGEGSYDIAEHYQLGTSPEITSGGVSAQTWFKYGDMTPGGIEDGDEAGVGGDGGTIPWTRPIPGGRCGSTVALVLMSSGYQDYGSGFEDYHFGNLVTTSGYLNGQLGILPYNASKYEGIAFWARSPGATTKAVTLQATDGHSNDDSVMNLTSCIYEVGVDAGSGSGSGTTTITSASGSATTTTGGSALPPLPPGTCGNTFSYVFQFTDDWQLYEIPFSAFFQAATPNRAPTGFDPSTFFGFGVIVPKEAQLELWIDELGFYPKTDGGL